jgi:hypothetical protein
MRFQRCPHEDAPATTSDPELGEVARNARRHDPRRGLAEAVELRPAHRRERKVPEAVVDQLAGGTRAGESLVAQRQEPCGIAQGRKVRRGTGEPHEVRDA